MKRVEKADGRVNCQFLNLKYKYLAVNPVMALFIAFGSLLLKTQHNCIIIHTHRPLSFPDSHLPCPDGQQQAHTIIMSPS